MLHWEPSGNGVRVTTAASIYEADRLILTTGAWLPSFMEPLAARARVFRQVLHWLPVTAPERFVPGTVGEPGQRTFFLQARSGNQVTSVVVEKQQVIVLAERLDQLLDEVRDTITAQLKEQAAQKAASDAAAAKK